MAGMDLGTMVSRKRLIIAAVLAALCVLLVLLIPDATATPRQLAGLTEKEIDELWPPGERDADVPNRPADTASEPSPTAKPDTRSLAERDADARKRQKETTQQVRQLLKQPITVLPAPALGIECEKDEVTRMLTSQLVQQYVRQASEPEAGLLKQLAAARGELQRLGADAGESYELESQLADRLIAKAQLLLKTTKNERDKVPAVLGFALRAGQLAALLNDKGREQQVLSAAAAWLSELVPAIVKDIKTKHDYALVGALLDVTRAANLSGLESGNVDVTKVFEQIEAAMQFDLTLTFDLKSVGANGSTEEWTLKSVIPLKFTLGGTRKVVIAMLAGSGTGNYERYADLDPQGRLRMRAAGFPVQGKIEPFDACEGKGQLYIDVFYAETETYIFKSGPDAALPVVKAAWTVLFSEQQKEGLYSFDVPVTNLDANAIDTKINKAMGVFDGTLSIKLVHKPK